MFNHIADLVGKSFSASIGEPWDFESDAGQNKLEGKIQKIVFDNARNPLLFCEVSPFSFSGNRISQVVAVNRYISSQDVINDLSVTGTATLNFIFQKSGDSFSVDGIDSTLGSLTNCSFIVGTMKLKQ